MLLCVCSGDDIETLELTSSTVNPGEPKTGPYDFELLRLLGKGGYGKVSVHEYNWHICRHIETEIKSVVSCLLHSY